MPGFMEAFRTTRERNHERHRKMAFVILLLSACLGFFLTYLCSELYYTVSDLSAMLAILGFSLLWIIRELFEQQERVRKGWFPRIPNRKIYDNM